MQRNLINVVVGVHTGLWMQYKGSLLCFNSINWNKENASVWCDSGEVNSERTPGKKKRETHPLT